MMPPSPRGVSRLAHGPAQSPGVVHLGLGAFHRAHQAIVFDDLLRSGDTRWGIAAFGMQSDRVSAVLADADGWFPVSTNAPPHAWRWVGSIWETGVVSANRAQAVEAIAAPDTRWLTLTVTEKGYTPWLADLIVDGLSHRFTRGLDGLTIASCDNLRGNGRHLKACCEEVAEALSPKLAHWIHLNCRFPNSMVDRIVPAPTPEVVAMATQALGEPAAGAVVAEPFWEWVIEHDFCDPTDAEVLARVGVTVVDDVSPYEFAKLQLLNGAHSTIAFVGVLAGLETVYQAMSQPWLSRWLRLMMEEELQWGITRPNTPDYIAQLLERFANPALAHKTAQIASDSSQKIKQRWVPVISAILATGRIPRHLAIASAAWVHCLKKWRADNQPINDPLAIDLVASIEADGHDGARLVRSLLGIERIWTSALTTHDEWIDAVVSAYHAIAQHGIQTAVESVAQSAPHHAS
jgi:fructuronate reductase